MAGTTLPGRSARRDVRSLSTVSNLRPGPRRTFRYTSSRQYRRALADRQHRVRSRTSRGSACRRPRSQQLWRRRSRVTGADREAGHRLTPPAVDCRHDSPGARTPDWRTGECESSQGSPRKHSAVRRAAAARFATPRAADRQRRPDHRRCEVLDRKRRS